MLFSFALSWAASCSTSFTDWALLLLHTALKWSLLLQSVHLFPYAGHCLRGWLLQQYLHVCFVGIFVCMYLLGPSLCVFFTIFSLPNSFASMTLFLIVDWALCASSLFAQANTFSLAVSLFSCIFVSYLFSLAFQCLLNHD